MRFTVISACRERCYAARTEG